MDEDGSEGKRGAAHIINRMRLQRQKWRKYHINALHFPINYGRTTEWIFPLIKFRIKGPVADWKIQATPRWFQLTGNRAG